jgi:hypothetical protein
VCSIAGTYEDVGHSATIAAYPATVHFGGFTAGQVMEVLVRLINIAATPQRLQVLPPDSNDFKVRDNILK